MSRFQTLLERVGAELALPGPTRVEILEELAGDLEDLYARYRSEGHDHAEALRLATERLAPSAEAVGELVSVHAPVYRRWLARYERPGEHRVERALFGMGGVVAVGSATFVLGRAALEDPSPFLVPVLGLGAVVVTLLLAKLFQLWVVRDHRPAALGRGLGGLLGLGLATPLVATYGVVLDLYMAAGAIERQPALQFELALRWVRQDATLLAAGLAIALVAVGGWSGLRRRMTISAEEERRIMGLRRELSDERRRAS